MQIILYYQNYRSATDNLKMIIPKAVNVLYFYWLVASSTKTGYSQFKQDLLF